MLWLALMMMGIPTAAIRGAALMNGACEATAAGGISPFCLIREGAKAAAAALTLPVEEGSNFPAVHEISSSAALRPPWGSNKHCKRTWGGLVPSHTCTPDPGCCRQPPAQQEQGWH